MITYKKHKITEGIKEYGLEDFVSKILPPQTYILTKRNSVKESVMGLVYDMKLRPIILNIPKKQGSKTSIGKLELIKLLYGLNRYAKEQIEKADPKWLRKTIKYAFKHQCPVKCSTMVRLKEMEEKLRKSAQAKQEKEDKEAELEKKLDEAKKANPDEVFDAALIDLPLAPENFDLNSLKLPLADNALLLVVVEADDMMRGLEFIKHQNAVYKTNFIWDRDRIFVNGEWCKNRHTMFLLAVKGDPERPHNTFKAESVFFEHQSSATHYVPDYFYELIENMCLGKQYLEVFSNRQFSDSWHILDTKTNNLTNGEK